MAQFLCEAMRADSISDIIANETLGSWFFRKNLIEICFLTYIEEQKYKIS